MGATGIRSRRLRLSQDGTHKGVPLQNASMNNVGAAFVAAILATNQAAHPASHPGYA